jgi:peptide-methionine (S)-S-oxide reductase
MEKKAEIITLGGGCFWCLETVFKDLAGVLRVESGYAGGSVSNPSYERVCSGTTGHAEVVQVTFSPDVISLREILDVFFSIHDPTTPNRQGADVGTQYRSIILYHSEEQKSAAEQVIRDLEAAHLWDAPISTELIPLEMFYPAEGYHQDYYTKNPEQPYCRVVVAPKLSKFRKTFRAKLKPKNGRTT